MADRSAYDPYAPAAGSATRDPLARLERAGVPEDARTHLRAYYDELPATARREFVRSLTRSSDTAILGRFVGAEGESTAKLTVPQLQDRLRARGLPVSGKKDELTARLAAPAPEQPAEVTQDGPADPAGAGEPGESPADPETPDGDSGSTTAPEAAEPAAADTPTQED